MPMLLTKRFSSRKPEAGAAQLLHRLVAPFAPVIRLMRPTFALLLTLLLALWLSSGCAPKPPRLLPHSVSVSRVTAQSLQLTFDLEVFNDNSFPLAARHVEGAVRVNGAVLGRGSARPEGTVPAKSSKRLSAQLDVPWTNVGALAPFVMSAQPVPYVFVGKATLGGEDVNFDLPFELTGQLSSAQLLQAGLTGLKGM